jgi:hypothetical protein
MERKKKQTKERKSFRLSEICIVCIDAMYKEFNGVFTYSDIVELGILEASNRLSKALKKNGLNYKALAEDKEKELLRSLVSYERGQIKSRHLFIVRMLKDISLYVSLKRPDKEINELIDVYCKEAQFYSNPIDLLDQVKTVKGLSRENITALRERMFKTTEELKDVIVRERQIKRIEEVKHDARAVIDIQSE